MKAKRQKSMGPWEIVTAALAVLLLLNVAAFAILCAVARGPALDLTELTVTGVLLLLGLLLLPFARRKCRSALWRGLLLAGVLCSAAVILFCCIAVAAALAA